MSRRVVLWWTRWVLACVGVFSIAYHVCTWSLAAFEAGAR